VQETLHDTLARHKGNKAAAARELGISPSTFKDRLVALAREGSAPGHFNNGTAPGYLMGKVTVQRNADGDVERTWERQSPDREAWYTAMREAVEALKEELPRSTPVPSPKARLLTHLCNLLTFTDYHLGCLAWKDEGGADWDVKIAENTLTSANAALLAQAPPAHTLVVNIQGDFLHTDGKLPLTPASKHVLDADSRYPKIRKAAIRLIRHLVQVGLQTHQHVHLIVAEGNHDEEGSGWLADLFSVLYEVEPRVTVDDSPLPFYVYEWGKTMLGVHHGHKVKNEQLPLLYAAQFPEIWGRTTKREIHCGHRHHRDEKEYNGVTVIQHPTLAARDAYAARGGWIAERSAQLITYHKEYGQVGRVSVCPEMLEAA
jgi:hypothetical protein